MVIYLFGDSHSHTIAKYLASAPEENEGSYIKASMLGIGRTFLKQFHEVTNEGVVFTNELHKTRFEVLTSNKAIKADSNIKYILSMGFHGVYFFNSPLWNEFTLDTTNTKKHFLTSRAFEQMVVRFNLGILRFIDDLKKQGCDIYVLSSPNLNSRFFKSRERHNQTEYEVQLVDLYYRKAFSNALDRRNLTYILPPDSSHDNGVLKDEFCRTIDSDYHANEKYGELVVKQIKDIFGT